MGWLRTLVRDADRMPGAYKVAASCVLSASFGVCVTAHLLFMPGHPYLLQIVSSAVKVPAIVLSGGAAATCVLAILSRIWSRRLRPAVIVHAAAGCALTTGLVLALSGPPMIVIASLGNYTVLLAATYGAFAVAGLAGCWTVARRLAVGRRPSRLNPLVWTVTYALAGASVGWNVRPIVGWTGVPFTWFRHDTVSMWNQIRCEGRNLQRGGAPLPDSPDAFQVKDFPCTRPAPR